MAKTQMNVRIDPELKREGDEVFASLGCSPTQVVDIIWRFAASNQQNRRRVKKVLDSCQLDSQSEEEARRARMQAGIEKHRQLMETFAEMAAEGDVEPSFTLSEASNEALHELAFAERAAEKGWS